jgi:hypothetical protein
MALTEIHSQLAVSNPYSGEPPKTKAEHIVLTILSSMCDRRGIKFEMNQVDDDVRKEMVTELTVLVNDVLSNSPLP